jgi:xylulokinase
MIVAHDLGTSGNKASLHDDRGRLVDAVSAGYPVTYRGDTDSEQDPDEWWRAVVETTRQLLAKNAVRPDSVHGICVSGQMMGTVALDAGGNPVRPAMIWSDQRSTAQTERLLELVDADTWYQITGHRMAPTYTLPKLLWIRDNEPESWRQTAHVCVAKDYVNLRLTGRLVMDHSDASSTDAYDLTRGTWSQQLLDAAGVDIGMWPELVDSTAVVGTLTGQAADALGLPTSVRVIAGGGDGPMSGVGAGCVRGDSPGYVCLGTSAYHACTTAGPVFDPEQRSFCYRHVATGLYNPCATTQSGAGTLEWLRTAVAAQASVPELIAEGLQAEAASEGLFLLPYFLGERTPWWDPHAAGTIVGLRKHHGRPQLVRAALEGVGFGLALCLESLRPWDSGRGVDVIGGGAGSDGWLQLLADIWGTSVRRRNVTSQANSLGAAVTALVGMGMADFEVAEGLSHVEAEFTPGSQAGRYQEYLGRFTAAYRSLAGWFAGA